MPKDSFDGVMAGGITLKEKKKETTTSADQSKGLAINNEYSYVVAIILQQNETKVQPDLKLLGLNQAKSTRETSSMFLYKTHKQPI